MLKPGVNLKRGVPLFLLVFIVSAFALYGGALLVETEDTAADTGDGGPIGGPTIITIVAQNLRFDRNSIAAGPGLDVTITLDNRDAGVPHNVAFYTNRSASQKIATTNLITGPATDTLNFTAPAAGNYFFRCDAHPDVMTGAFIVR